MEAQCLLPPFDAWLPSSISVTSFTGHKTASKIEPQTTSKETRKIEQQTKYHRTRTVKHLRQTQPNMPAQTLVFATCQHTAPLEALPRNIQTTPSDNSTSRTTYITRPSNCLTCTIQFTLQRHGETKDFFAAKIREVRNSHERNAVSVRNDRDRDFVLENGKAALAEIASDGDKAIREIWRTVIDMWNGASQDARSLVAASRVLCFRPVCGRVLVYP